MGTVTFTAIHVSALALVAAAIGYVVVTSLSTIDRLRSEVRYLESLLDGLLYGSGSSVGTFGLDEVADFDVPTGESGVED